jgi:hypothetical protein
MIRWPEYLKRFEEQYDALKNDLLKPGAIECNGGPVLRPSLIRGSQQAPWKAEWAVLFPDGNYFRVKECFNRKGYPNSGAGIREHFSFHYGKAHPNLSPDGYPDTRAKDTPVADLRIDTDFHRDPHIHVNSEEHLTQNRVIGYSIQDADMFKFLEAVRDHRKNKDAITELLNIKVIP